MFYHFPNAWNFSCPSLKLQCPQFFQLELQVLALGKHSQTMSLSSLSSLKWHHFYHITTLLYIYITIILISYDTIIITILQLLSYIYIYILLYSSILVLYIYIYNIYILYYHFCHFLSMAPLINCPHPEAWNRRQSPKLCDRPFLGAHSKNIRRRPEKKPCRYFPRYFNFFPNIYLGK